MPDQPAPPTDPLHRPIGVFDSGVGGLSVLRALRQHLPAETFYYVADTAHAPYGDRSADYIINRTVAIGDFLITQNVKALVLACNTATALTLPLLRARYRVPVIALEPAVKPAVEATQSGVVGVLATRRTLESVKFQELAARFSDRARIIAQPCPRLVPMVEQGVLEGTALEAALRDYVAPLLAAGADTLVLGCTHYVFLQDLLHKIAGPQVRIFESGPAVARRTADQLQSTGQLSAQAQGSEAFWSSEVTDEAEAVLRKLWGAPLTLQPLPV